MLKRVKLVAYAAALFCGSLLASGCGWYGLALDNIPRVIIGILNEELFS
ncbi:MAG TPA: hypothetical protein VLM89_00530 [Phycisphaerae bacterium]|nr:hypothetical protein [Phycisphaerae bacterium]